MIRFFLLQNKQGKTRLSKWYQTAPDDLERVKLEADVHRIISMRGRGYTNFVEVCNFFLLIVVISDIECTFLMSFSSSNSTHFPPRYLTLLSFPHSAFLFVYI